MIILKKHGKYGPTFSATPVFLQEQQKKGMWASRGTT